MIVLTDDGLKTHDPRQLPYIAIACNPSPRPSYAHCSQTMLSLADADKEEARYQKLPQASAEDRTPIPSRARGYDIKPLLQPLLLEETARSMAPCLKLSKGAHFSLACLLPLLHRGATAKSFRLTARHPVEEMLAVVESLSPSDDAVYEAPVGMEFCARPTSRGEATTPTQDTGGLTPIIESDGLATPLSETILAETDPADILTASQNGTYSSCSLLGTKCSYGNEHIQRCHLFALHLRVFSITLPIRLLTQTQVGIALSHKHWTLLDVTAPQSPQALSLARLRPF